MGYMLLSSQNALGTASTNSVSATYPGSTQVGDLLIATAFSSGLTLGTPAITGWILAVNESFLALADNSTIFYRVADGTETTITATCSGSSSMIIAIHEFWTANLQTTQTWLDQTNTTTAGLATGNTMGSISPTKPNELIICGMVFPSGGTSGWNFPSMTVMSSNTNMADAFVISQNTNAFAPAITWSGISTSGGCIASFFVGSQGDTQYRHLIVGNGISVNEVAN